MSLTTKLPLGKESTSKRVNCVEVFAAEKEFDNYIANVTNQSLASGASILSVLSEQELADSYHPARIENTSSI